MPLCTGMTQDGKPCRNPISPKRWAAGDRDCDQHTGPKAKKPSEQCLGTTKEGKQCKRRINGDDWADGVRGCRDHTHINDVNKKLDKKLADQRDRADSQQSLSELNKRKLKAEIHNIEADTRKTEAEIRKIEAETRNIESAAERSQRALVRAAERAAAEIPPKEKECAERGAKTRIKEVDTEKREAYTQEGQTREKQSDNADATGRLSRARAHGKKQIKRLVVGTGRVARRTRKWASNTVTKENAKRVAKWVAQFAIELLLRRATGGL